MNIIIINHARSRMVQYGITEEMIISCLKWPDEVLGGQNNRLIAQQRLNSLVLRIIYEVENENITIVTVYKAKGKRYELPI